MNRLLGTLSDDMLQKILAKTNVKHAACAAVVIGLRLLADVSKNADDTPAPVAVGGGTTVNAGGNGGTGGNGLGGVTMEIGLADRSAAGVADQGGERQEGEAAPPRDGAAMEAELGALRQENADLRQSNQALERRMAAAREHLLGVHGTDEDGSDDDLIDEDVDGVLV
mmetsp:Transcript_13340/g.31622  ORF Transcript_13340/g.31622 Transcript_13340/m.31622 type:complete len:168 (-) Transcript_13340:38-541(-)